MNEEINKIINWVEMSYTRLNYKEELLLVNYIKQLQQENARLKGKRKQIKEYVEKCNFDNAEILYDFGSEYCYIDDFKEHILEILKEN